ncbi:MAG: helix-turn-helix protein [Spirosoma sp.]|nr:helix-turn-helix protein [Spirosoma sp.]
MPHRARPPYRTAVRHKPSIEHSIEPPVLNNARASAAERLQAFRGKRDGDEVVQNRIAQRLGNEGWLVLGALTDAQRAKLTNFERRGELTDERLAGAVLDARFSQPP